MEAKKKDRNSSNPKRSNMTKRITSYSKKDNRYKFDGSPFNKPESSADPEVARQLIRDYRKKYGYGGKMKYKKGGFPDLTGDGKVTMADILKGRGVKEYAKGGMVSSPKVEKLKLLKQQLSAAKTSRYATEEDRKKDIAMIERQIRDLGV